MIRPFEGRSPIVHATAWVAPGACVIGDVEIGADSSIWYGSVIRGDIHQIRIGARTNLQDQCTVHVTRGRFATWIGDEVSVGHRAVVHGCRVGDGALIGIGAIVLDGAEVGEGALIGAGAVVTPGTAIGDHMLAVGIPAREVRELDQDERRTQLERTLKYVETARRHAAADVG
ncbi:MAG: gamma carbonic anhydrase family protein [Deltaproteobacteria bacterium]|nr:gamma carbonic anhydrase family protein [Deltaproteobacteria bacterium]